MACVMPFLREKNLNVVLLIGRHLQRRCVSNKSKSQVGVQDALVPEEKINIPRRIERGPTDILKALASTVQRDYTASHYKYHDDPFLIPASNTSKRMYALSKESGRKAAKWIRDELPDCFEDDPAFPHIKAFMAKPTYTENSDVTVATLRQSIDEVDVTTSVNLYQILKTKGIEVDKDTKQSMLELLCFYNGENPTDEDFIEERWFRRQSAKGGRKTWKESGIAEALFTELKPNNRQAYLTMIRGLAKYLQTERAHVLYKEMHDNQMPLDTETYNQLLGTVSYMMESSEARWSLAEQLLSSMQQEGIQPNLGTFNALLETVSRLGTWKDAKKLALQILAEMKRLGIEPSLGSYYFMLVIFCRERGPISTILYDIMRQLEGKEFEIRNPKDVLFFIAAMEVCHLHVNDKDLALKVHALLCHGQNYVLIGDSIKESIYYQHFLRLLCQTESIETFFDYYDKLVPHVYTPEPSVMLEIIEAVDLNGVMTYVPQIWSDMLKFDHVIRENLMEALLKVLGSNKPGDELQQKFAEIAWGIKEKIDSQRPMRSLPAVQWTGPMLGNVMLTCLNADDYSKACEVMEQCDLQHHKIAGPPRADQLQRFIKAAIAHEDASNAVMCANYMSSNGYQEAVALAQEIMEKLPVNDKQKSILTEVATTKLSEESG